MPINNLLIDFDHTLLNTPQVKYEWAAAMEKCGVPEQVFWRTYPLARYGETGKASYNPRRHVDFLKVNLSCSLDEAMQEIEKVIKKTGDFLYPGAKTFLSRMMSLNVPMTLVLHGEKEYQQEKVVNSGIADFFSQIYFSDKDRLEIVKELKLDSSHKIFWLSHKLEDLVKVKKAYPFITPIIKRRADVPLVHYRETGFLNFENFEEMQDYLTIIQATSY
ncbi:MAG TPA: HAD hydrolase-like protein [Candidatus Magasanikbacteria bacterium]|nr:HAD hydrolase-like protein [Candidatus Magasanikbacteria bacterium]